MVLVTMSMQQKVNSGVWPGLLNDLEARGLVKQMTDPALEKFLASEPITVYAGFDPTADSLHIGHLLPVLTLKRFQLAGHNVIAVVGGATGMIGDPSGKSAERNLLTQDQLAHNVKGISATLSRFLDFNSSNPARVMNNYDWFKGFDYIDFLRDIGKHFTVNHMVAKESVRARLEDREHGISYTEFSYMLLQAYDFYYLNRKEGCRLQIGGSDQWGNITAGTDLIRRKSEATEPVFGLTQPLVTKADGTKFGKTEQGAVWLDPERTSPYQFYQFLIQTADADVMTLLRYFTFLPLEEIAALEESLKTAPEKREAQRALARELTSLVHGKEELARVEQASQSLFGAEIKNLDARTLLDVLAGAPSTRKEKDALQEGYPLVDALVDAGLCNGKGAARKDITSGGIYVNNDRMSDPAVALTEKDLIAGKFIVLRKGKKNYHLLQLG